MYMYITMIDHAKPYFPARGYIHAFHKLILGNSGNSEKDILSTLE